MNAKGVVTFIEPRFFRGAQTSIVIKECELMGTFSEPFDISFNKIFQRTQSLKFAFAF